MWRKISVYFKHFPKRRKLAQKLLEYGLKIQDNNIFCKDIELSDSKIARAFQVDRRIISSTIEMINEKKELKELFSRLEPTCHMINVAPIMNWGVIEIIPDDPSQPGILAEVAKVVAESNISIRQAIVDDFEITDEPRLFIVAEKQLPGSLIPKIRNIKGVKAVVIR